MCRWFCCSDVVNYMSKCQCKENYNIITCYYWSKWLKSKIVHDPDVLWTETQ